MLRVAKRNREERLSSRGSDHPNVVSTAASDKIGKVEGQRLTVGLDVGDRSSWYCVLDEAGAVLLEQKLPTTPKAMKEYARRGRHGSLGAALQHIRQFPFDLQQAFLP